MKNQTLKLYLGFAVALSVSIFLSGSSTVHAATYTFPVLGSSSYSNDFDAPRASGKHNAIDIIAKKGQKIVAATGGIIQYVEYPQRSTQGYMIVIQTSSGYRYYYIHLNNDTPGTDNGNGSPKFTFAPGVGPGSPVARGQLLGYVGDSGNAESTVPHLHFEVHNGNDTAINPFNSLRNAERISTPKTTPARNDEILPYGQTTIGLNVAVGDIDFDGTRDTVVGTGEKAIARVKIYSADKRKLADFYPFGSKDYQDGVDVAVGDVDGDGKLEIITAGRRPDGSRVAVFKYNSGSIQKYSEFLVYSGVRSIPRVTSEDINNDGTDEIITGTGIGQNPRANIFSGTGQRISKFSAFGDNFQGGIDVAVGDVSGTSDKEIIISRLSSGTSLIRVFSITGQLITQFYSHGSGHREGSRVSVANLIGGSSTKKEIIAVTQQADATAFVMDGSGTKLQELLFLEEWWKGYYDIAADSFGYKTVTGIDRRASVQKF